ncbi:MAG: energy-coupling factor transporter ATPase [Clostridia bacterium]|nr:energy-coupling factor transporter ATPase [Clostridia bacterium]
MEILKTEHLRFVYSPGTPFEKTAIDDISITVSEGEFIGIIGHTGSGKSTLVQHLNGLLKPTGGKVFVMGQDIHRKGGSLRDVRFKVGLVFQYPEHQLFDETVYKDIAFGPTNMGLGESEIKERVRYAAKFTGLSEDLLEKSPFDLSGGQKRRAAIAGVIAMMPKILILDEPTAGLDPGGRDEILEQINQYRKQTGTTVLLVSHSMEDIAEHADRVLVLNKGRLMFFDTTERVFRHSRELEQIGLQVPDVTKTFLLLRDMGMPVDTGVYTVEDAADQLKKIFAGVKGC